MNEQPQTHAQAIEFLKALEALTGGDGWAPYWIPGDMRSFSFSAYEINKGTVAVDLLIQGAAQAHADAIGLALTLKISRIAGVRNSEAVFSGGPLASGFGPVESAESPGLATVRALWSALRYAKGLH